MRGKGGKIADVPKAHPATFGRATSDLELTRLFMRHAFISTASEHCIHTDREELDNAMRLLDDRWRRA